MGRLHFSWPSTVREEVRRHVMRAIERLDPSRYRQETAYVDALVGRLDGIAYRGPFGKVEFLGTILTDRGKSSAESAIGADFAITASLRDRRRSVEKGILVQAKRGHVSQLPREEQERLNRQIERMQQHTSAPKVLQVPMRRGQVPSFVSGRKVVRGIPYKEFPAGEYVTRYIMTCIEGDARPGFVRGISESTLTKLRVDAELAARQSKAH